METIRNEVIESGTAQCGRVYLCGDLQYNNGIEYIQTSGYEIGITAYPKYTFEKAHLHTFNKEYNYVLEGQLKVFLLSEEQEYLFKKGDLFVIDTNEPYVSKATAGTKTLFSKVPGGNDKVLVTMSEPLLSWGQSWDNIYIKE